MVGVMMNDGLEILAVGCGTFMMSSAEVSEHLPEAIALGYRHIDTANAYFNEVAVGRAIKASGISREEFFVTTKLFPQGYGSDVCDGAIDDSLRRLDMDYVDLLLLHQPYGSYLEAWKVLERAQRDGRVRSIGLSNFNRARCQEVLDVATVTPQVLQVEINPRDNQHALKGWLESKGVVFEGWYPLGHGDRRLIDSPLFCALAQKYGKTSAQVILRWHLQEGNVVFPKTVDPAHMRQNLDIFDFALTPDEMARIGALPQRPYYTVSDEAPSFALCHCDFDRQQ